jgi:biopolymer transport protein ExbD
MRAGDGFSQPPKRRRLTLSLAPFVDLLLILIMFLLLLAQFGDPPPSAETEVEEKLENGP